MLPVSPFIEFLKEDKSVYPLANTKGYIDLDNDFLIGNSGGFLMNINFKFVNTELLNEVARNYERRVKDGWEGKEAYSGFREGTQAYREFWERETKRRREGFTAPCKLINGKIENLRITGDHYTYLNYGRIRRTLTEDEKAEAIRNKNFKVKKKEGFPRFQDGDYWGHKIDEFCINNQFHNCKAKARRKGYSYQKSNKAANTINSNKGVTVIFVADDIKYLTDPSALTDMCKVNLDWYENNTYWKRGYLSEDYKHIELGYKKQKDGNKKFGFRSKLLSLSIHDNPSIAIGKDGIEITVEEAGKCPRLQEFLNVTASSTEAGAEVVGFIDVFGTAGVKDADWTTFSKAFYNPLANGMLPMENVWDINARYTTCGFFHPQIWTLEPYMDKYGNSIVQDAYEYDLADKEEKKQNSSLSDWLIYVGQRANSPSEAFRGGNENIFSSPELNDAIRLLETDKSLRYWRDGMIVNTPTGVRFKTNEQLKVEGSKIHPFIERVPFDSKDDIDGCFREFYPPQKVNGIIPDNLYYIVVDTVGIDKDKKKISNKNSLNALYVLMYPNNFGSSCGDIIMACYVGRFGSNEDFSKLILNACKYYNAKCLPEVDRGTVVADFRRLGELNRLYKDPTSIIDEKVDANTKANYGIMIGEGDKAADGILYLKDWLYTPLSKDAETGNTLYVLNYIRDLPLLKELAIYNNTGNYDRISALRVAMFQRQAYRVKRIKVAEKRVNTTIGSLGLYEY